MELYLPRNILTWDILITYLSDIKEYLRGASVVRQQVNQPLHVHVPIWSCGSSPGCSTSGPASQ